MTRALLLAGLAALAACGGSSAPAEMSAAAPTQGALSSPIDGDASVIARMQMSPPPVDQVAPSSSEPTPAPAAPEPVFAFEQGEQLDDGVSGQAASFSGMPGFAGSITDGTSWYDVDPGALTVQYEGGDALERSARVVVAPDNPTNHVLAFTLHAANVRDAGGVATKGRVQLNAYVTEHVRAREVRLRVRMRLGAGFAELRNLPTSFHWLTLSEWWNNASWGGQGHPFRITLNVTKPVAAAGAQLYFGVRAETLDVATNTWNAPTWGMVNRDLPVPVDQWVTLEYHFREGDATGGRFYLALVDGGGARHVIFDHTGWTHHPEDPAPDGLTQFNPLKLYTSRTLIDHVRASGASLQVLWDDIGFRLCRERFEPVVSPCRPETFH